MINHIFESCTVKVCASSPIISNNIQDVDVGIATGKIQYQIPLAFYAIAFVSTPVVLGHTGIAESIPYATCILNHSSNPFFVFPELPVETKRNTALVQYHCTIRFT